jgi:PAS domain S-box-containing protein
MGGEARPPQRPTIPWHRRLEARVLLGVALIAGLSLASVAIITSRVVRSHAFEHARTDLASARAAFVELISTRAESADARSGLIIDLPVFRAHMASSALSSDPATMEEHTRANCQRLKATFCVVTSADGTWLASHGLGPNSAAASPLAAFVRQAPMRDRTDAVLAIDGSLYLVVSRRAMFLDEVIGALTSAYRLDDEMARGLAQITRSQIGFVVNGAISGSSFQGAQRQAFEDTVRRGIPASSGDMSEWRVAGAPYVGAAFPLGIGGGQAAAGTLILLEEWTPTEHFIQDIVTQLSWAGGAVFALAVMGSIIMSRRMSRPLRDIADRAAEMAAGEWERRLPVKGSAEAMAMAQAFNDMTASLTHWQREARQRAEQLQAAYERYAAVTNSAPDAIVSTDADGAILFWNQSAERAFGCAEADALGRTLASLLADGSQALCREVIADAGRSDSTIHSFDVEGRRQDGTHFPCELTVASWKAGGASFLTAIIRDVTERRRSEEALRQRDAQLVQAQKMEAMGRLASGVAHDFNNALAVIQGYTEEMLISLGEQSEHQADLREVLKACGSAASLTRQLLMFSRKQAVEPQLLHLGEVIENVQRMLRKLVGDEVDLRIAPAPENDVVIADRGHLEQILVNLCVNARDAMSEGGTVAVAVRHTDIQDSVTCARLGIPAGTYVTLSVSDTGTGMDPLTASRVFEPFFTTKEAGKGTGLGLALVFGIVRQSGGAIDLDTRPGHGTTFAVHLPLARKGEESASLAGDEEVGRGTETVLLVEDEAPVRVILRRTLEAAGYQVLAAASGAEALEISRRREEDIHLLLTDVLMPGLNGVALSQIVAAERPATRVLFMSGHPKETFARHGLDPASVRLLQKPFSSRVLCRELREVLA